MSEKRSKLSVSRDTVPLIYKIPFSCIMSYADPRKEALQYLEKHSLLRLFDILGAKLAFVKPDDPNAFLMAELIKIASFRQSGHPVHIKATIIGVMK